VYNLIVERFQHKFPQSFVQDDFNLCSRIISGLGFQPFLQLAGFANDGFPVKVASGDGNEHFYETVASKRFILPKITRAVSVNVFNIQKTLVVDFIFELE
jgi:hypothetical protein